jgi:formylmethanofuran dehydrogenase subunit E
MMKVEKPKQRVYTEELEERAIEFHGHGGPFMIIGLRMGLTALEILDTSGWFGIKCRVFLHWAPPDSCVIDGIQTSTGCTMGKHNIEVEERDGVSAEFYSTEKKVAVTLRDDVLSRIRDDLHGEEETIKKRIDWLRKAETNQVFHVKHEGESQPCSPSLL